MHFVGNGNDKLQAVFSKTYTDEMATVCREEAPKIQVSFVSSFDDKTGLQYEDSFIGGTTQKIPNDGGIILIDISDRQRLLQLKERYKKTGYLTKETEAMSDDRFIEATQRYITTHELFHACTCTETPLDLTVLNEKLGIQLELPEGRKGDISTVGFSLILTEQSNGGKATKSIVSTTLEELTVDYLTRRFIANDRDAMAVSTAFGTEYSHYQAFFGFIEYDGFAGELLNLLNRSDVVGFRNLVEQATLRKLKTNQATCNCSDENLSGLAKLIADDFFFASFNKNPDDVLKSYLEDYGMTFGK